MNLLSFFESVKKNINTQFKVQCMKQFVLQIVEQTLFWT